MVYKSTTDISTIFELDPTTITRSDLLVPRSAYFRLKHLNSGSWVHSMCISIDSEDDKLGFSPLAMGSMIESLTIIPPSCYKQPKVKSLRHPSRCSRRLSPVEPSHAGKTSLRESPASNERATSVSSEMK
ncbi:unnamed protein product, partial [Cyprideis torosa]